MTMVGSAALIRLYPRAWQQRYGAEMRELLAQDRFSVRAAADLIAGAIDARIYPQQIPVQPGREAGDKMMMTRTLRCAPAGVTTADQVRSVVWMIGGSIVLTVAGLLLKLQIGPNALSEGLLYSSFPAAFMLSSECTYLKRYSTTARIAMSVGGAVFVILIMWAAVLIANSI